MMIQDENIKLLYEIDEISYQSLLTIKVSELDYREIMPHR